MTCSADDARELKVDRAYDSYLRVSTRRFDLMGQAETIRQLQAQMSPCKAVGEHAISERIRGILIREHGGRELVHGCGKSPLPADS
jgi:hypothetical protein